MIVPSEIYQLSGVRFQVEYRITGNQEEALIKAQDICYEQTVEFPADLTPEGFIKDQIVGKIEQYKPVETEVFSVLISYAVETSGFNLPQLLNVVFGNISIKPGIRVQEIYLPEELLNLFRGPRFGRDGLRNLMNVKNRPLICTALKPMGLSARDLAQQAYQFALGGIDMIKDDHGLADQPFCPFKERIQRCSEAIQKANQQTGQNALYIPNISGTADKTVENAYFAKNAGAGGLLICPAIVGMDMMRLLADDDAIQLPIIGHPAFQGSYVTDPNSGISHKALYGQLTRLAGADATVYPNWGGRFSFSKEECKDIVHGTKMDMGHIRPIFPAPGGGMTMERIPEMLEVYGRDLIFLIGGGLHRLSPDLTYNSRHFRNLIEKM